MIQWYNYSMVQWWSYKNCPKIAYFSFLLVPKMFFYFVNRFFCPEKGISINMGQRPMYKCIHK